MRPLLRLRKEELRNYLRNNNYTWIEDPSNYDNKYRRVQMRKLLQQLKSNNLITSNFVKTADHMLRASKLSKEIAKSNCKNLLSFNDVGQITFEIEKFSSGSNKIAKKISENTRKKSLISIAGGGDTVAAINKSNCSDGFTYISTAGGAFLELLEGKILPGIKVLEINE